MSLLDGLKRKKTKPVRDDVWDAPTLFGSLGNDSPNAEKRISVLSAAGAKPARRVKPRRTTAQSGRMIRPGYVVLLVGTLVFAGIWQSGIFDRPTAMTMAARFDSLLQSGLSLFAPSDSPAPTRTVRTQVSIATLPETHDADVHDAAPSAQAAQIERVALANTAGSRALEPTIPSPGSIEAALNTPGPEVATAQSPLPVTSTTPKAPAPKTGTRVPPKTSDTKSTDSRASRASTQASAPPRKDSVATEKSAERKLQVARSKEPDPDAQLLEALLVHLRKTEPAKDGSR